MAMARLAEVRLPDFGTPDATPEILLQPNQAMTVAG
jgi:hypothetical protein